MLLPMLYWLVAYLVGAIPFGYLIARSRGVNLFEAGSGNIGATNVGRVLGRKYGILTFVLDFLKGALPVALAELAAKLTGMTVSSDLGGVIGLRVGAGLLAFLGHLFPLYLGFRGGKGVATGAGVMAVLVPWPFVVAVLVWVSVTLASRTISLASICCVIALSLAQVAFVTGSLQWPGFIITAFVIVGTCITIVKHRSNLQRLVARNENMIRESAKLHTIQRCFHVLAVGSWFGAGLFFNLIAALPIFDSFKQVVAEQPSDRTAYQRIQPETASEEEQAALANALAGAAVGPLFPRYFVLSGLCCVVVGMTSWGLWRTAPTRVQKLRLILALIGVALVAVGWPISEQVSRLRLERFAPDTAVASAAKSAFATWHFGSLFLSLATTVVVGTLLALCGLLPSPTKEADVAVPPAG